jgi:D-threonine aldolase
MLFNIKNISYISTPALAIDLQKVCNNIDKALEICEAEFFRPHAKTFKTKEVAKLLIDRGVKKFKCATIAEAEMLAAAGAKDILLAYQPVGPTIRRLKHLKEIYVTVQFSCLVDNYATVTALSEVFVSDVLHVFIDLNCGMDRTGVHTTEAQSLIEFCKVTSGIHVIGLHAYDGDLDDIDYEQRSLDANNFLNTVLSVKKRVEQLFEYELKLVIGGSLNFLCYAQNKSVECSPGTFIFWDDGYAQFKEIPFELAAVVLTRIISIVSNNLMCLDLGHKAIASENPLNKRVRFLQVAVRPVAHSEEHMVVWVNDSSAFNVGDVFVGIPYHICPTVALHQEIQVIENQSCSEQWKVVARDRKIQI